jgi:hypothetical protein
VARRQACALLICLIALPITACARPTLTALDVTSGPPNTLVMVEGADLAGARVIWDAGASNKLIPGGFLGAYMFSVPFDATPGTYNVALENESGRRSASIPFQVIAREQGETSFRPPRIDYVTMLGTDFDANGVATALYVQGANFDVGAVVRVNNVDVPTASHKGLRGERFNRPASDFGYPIFHYVSSIALAGRHPAGSAINITVRNLDGQVSAPFSYTLPADLPSVDSDGDSLLDTWEINGYDPNGDGVREVDLPALGSNPLRRDLLLEIDIMDNLRNSPPSLVFDEARRMFASAPILNPLAPHGINLIIDSSGRPCLVSAGAERCSFVDTLFDIPDFRPSGPPPSDPFPNGEVWFSQLKARNFDNAARGAIYHYGVWSVRHTFGFSGQSDFADDLIVSFDYFDPPYQTPRSQIEAFVHELGHDLELRHAGDVDEPEYSPNYWSVMGYNWDLRTGWETNAERASLITCPPFYYGQASADEVGGAPPLPLTTNVDYSEGMGPTLAVGRSGTTRLCGKTIDWNAFGITSGPLEDFADWPALKFDGPASNQKTNIMMGIIP